MTNIRTLASAGLTAATAAALLLFVPLPAGAQGPTLIKHAVFEGTGDGAHEISTEDLEKVLAGNSATLLDARPHEEFAMGHIPGAVNVAPKAGVAMSMYVSDVAEIVRLLKGNKATALVLYCNGPHCGKSKRLATELRDAGYANVSRYQLGLPVWRALGGLVQIEREGITHVLANDRTAVVVDVREAADFKGGSLRQAVNIPRSLVVDAKDMGEVRRAKDDGRLPMNDHNTRIIVVGADAAAARHVAGRIALEAFSNVTYYAGSISELR